jgi:hypothetical protein
LDFTDLSAQWKTLSGQNNRMTRIQVRPQDAGSVYSALFAPGSGGYYMYSLPASQFFAMVSQLAGVTLTGIAYDASDGNVAGCWQTLSNPSNFVQNETWPALMTSAQQAAAGGMVLSAMASYPNAPDFESYFAHNLAPYVMGYSYAVSLNGNVISNGYG